MKAMAMTMTNKPTPMTTDPTSDAAAAAERLTRHAATAKHNYEMVVAGTRSLCRAIEYSAEMCELPGDYVRDLRTLADAYLAQSPTYADLCLDYTKTSMECIELNAKVTRLEAESDHDRLFARTVLSSLHWTGDGYEWTGGRFDYRMSPAQAVAATVNEINDLKERLRLATWSQEQLAKFDNAPVNEALLLSIPGSQQHALGISIPLPSSSPDVTRFLDCTDVRNITECPWEVASYFDGGSERAMIAEQIPTISQLNHLLAALRPGGVK